jgi:hypothetical protein
VPSNAVWAQTVIASLFAVVAFIVLPSIGVGGSTPIEIQTKVYDVTRPPTQEPGRCLGVSGRGSRIIEYPTTLVQGCSRDEDSPMSRVFLTHGAAQAVHALRSGRPRAQGGWVKGSCLVREGVPTDRRHAALTQRTTHRLRGTEDER